MAWFSDNASKPVTAFLDSNGDQLLDTVGIISAQINPTKSFSSHKLENGQVVTDNVIDNQAIINVGLILNTEDYQTVYSEIKALFDDGEAFTIQTRVDTYSNMYLDGMPHEEDASVANTIGINLNFIEQQIVTSSTSVLTISDVSNSADTSTVKAGQKTPVESSSSALLDSAEAVADFFGFDL